MKIELKSNIIPVLGWSDVAECNCYEQLAKYMNNGEEIISKTIRELKDDELSASWSGAITLFGYLTGALLNLDDFEKQHHNAVRLAIIIPYLIINSEHHLFFISPHINSDGSSIATSVFTNSRLDIFNDKWWRYSIGSGLQFEINFGDEECAYENKGIGIQFGAEVPVFCNGI